jgi:hypothetical protein
MPRSRMVANVYKLVAVTRVVHRAHVHLPCARSAWPLMQQLLQFRRRAVRQSARARRAEH